MDRAGLAAKARNRDLVKGQAFVVLILCLFVLLGFAALALDIGLMVLRANELQKTCDASALAAAEDIFLNPTLNTSPTYVSSANKAKVVGSLNNNGTITDVDFANITASSGTVTVTGTTTQNFFFAPVMGIKSSGITRIASSAYATLTGIPGVPLGITPADFATYRGGGPFTLSLVRNDKSAFGPGNVIGLSLGSGKSPSQWEDALINGSPQVTNSGDVTDLNSLNASLQNEDSRLQSGLAARVGTSFAIFITDPTPQTNGTSSHPIEGIVIVTLLAVDANGNITIQIPRTAPPMAGGVYGGAASGPTLGLTNDYKAYLVQ